MLIFLYGSDMSLTRLQERVPSARFVTVATLSRHNLRFHKVGIDGSGKCDTFFTNNPDHRVIGVIFLINDDEKSILDTKKGLGLGYDEKQVELVTLKGNILYASMYFAINIDPLLKPYHWYKDHVLVGAREHDFPEDYIARIVRINAIDDPDKARRELELKIYHPV